MKKRDAFSQCHPLVNFLFFVGAIGFGVVIQHPAYIALGCLGAAAYYLWLLPGKAWKTVLGMVPVFLFVAAINPLFNHEGEQVLFLVFGNPYTLEALCYGMAVAGILVVMLLWFCSYSLVLTSDKFICLFGSVIPSLSLLLTMVLRMIPSLVRKAKAITGSRDAIGKGLAVNAKNKEKLQNGAAVLSSLTDWALEGSVITADSMRSRGYGTAKRTSFMIYRMTGRDYALLAAMLLLAAATLFFDGFDAAYTPALSVAPVTWGLAAYGLFLGLPIILNVKEAIAWHISISRI